MAFLVLAFAIVVIAPPVWLLAYLSRRLARQQLRDESRLGVWVAIVGTVGLLAFQCAIAGMTVLEGFRGSWNPDRMHVIGLLVAWLCFCLRIALRFLRRPRGRRAY